MFADIDKKNPPKKSSNIITVITSFRQEIQHWLLPRFYVIMIGVGRVWEAKLWDPLGIKAKMRRLGEISSDLLDERADLTERFKKPP